jgi:hypothetical protein
MVKMTFKESFGDINAEYEISQNGSHGGRVSARIDEDRVIDNLDFSDITELMSALYNARLSVLIRASKDGMFLSTTASPATQSFIKGSVDHLYKMASRLGGRPGA